MNVPKIVLGPLLLAQGAWVRKRTLKLPEPQGSREGVIAAAEKPRLRLLIAGDSAAAGVGVDHQESALLGQLLTALTPTHSIAYTLWAKTGATSESTRIMLDQQQARPFDVVVLSLGVNDVTRDRPIVAIIAQHQAIVSLLRTKYQARLILASALPPVGQFPALPHPLRWYLGRAATALDASMARYYEAQPDCAYHRLPATMGNTGDMAVKDAMARDGFHPGAPVYRLWGQSLAQSIQAFHQL